MCSLIFVFLWGDALRNLGQHSQENSESFEASYIISSAPIALPFASVPMQQLPLCFQLSLYVPILDLPMDEGPASASEIGSMHWVRFCVMKRLNELELLYRDTAKSGFQVW